MKMQKIAVLTSVLLIVCAVSLIERAGAAGPKVSENGNKHNLSALAWTGATLAPKSIINTYQATNDATGNPGGQQVCIFCHTPHNANVLEGAPLWNRDFSSQTFSRYTSETLRIRIDDTAKTAAGYSAAWQPDGSSKLCLSCHDGVASLGNVLRGGPIAMTNDVITGIASFKPDTNKMKTGHHPVSFTYDSAVVTAINAGKTGYQMPAIAAVKLDRNGKMQCTSCHDAHQNKSDDTAVYSGTRKIVPFWVYNNGANTAVQDHDAVCTTCHPITGLIPENVAPWPYP